MKKSPSLHPHSRSKQRRPLHHSPRGQCVRPRLEVLEDRTVPFAASIHQDITQEALPFLKPELLSVINAAELDPAEYFNTGQFSLEAAGINISLQGALGFANPAPARFRSLDVATQFGQLLHQAQDFYA